MAFSLGGTALIFAAIGVSLDIFQWSLMYVLPERVFGIMSNYVLLAVPFFIFMGTMLEKSKLAEDLLTTIGALFGGMRGGLALCRGVRGRAARRGHRRGRRLGGGHGHISLPVMLRYGYPKELTTGVIAASAPGADHSAQRGAGRAGRPDRAAVGDLFQRNWCPG